MWWLTGLAMILGAFYLLGRELRAARVRFRTALAEAAEALHREREIRNREVGYWRGQQRLWKSDRAALVEAANQYRRKYAAEVKRPVGNVEALKTQIEMQRQQLRRRVCTACMQKGLGAND